MIRNDISEVWHVGLFMVCLRKPFMNNTYNSFGMLKSSAEWYLAIHLTAEGISTHKITLKSTCHEQLWERFILWMFLFSEVVEK